MRLSGLGASGKCWACHYCSHGLGDTLRSSRGASGLSQSRVQTVMALTGICASVQVLLLNVRLEAQLAGRGTLCGPGWHNGQPGGSRAWTCGPGVVSDSFNYPGCQGNHSLSGTIWGDKEALWKVPSRSSRGEATDHAERVEGAFGATTECKALWAGAAPGLRAKTKSEGSLPPRAPRSF